MTTVFHFSILQFAKLGLPLLPILLLSSTALSQVLTGTVADENYAALPGASVYWLATPETGVATDKEGLFSIPLPEDEAARRLVVSFVGYQSDTLSIRFVGNLFIQLSEASELATVEIAAARSSTGLANVPQKVEVISAKELTKAACCDLAGCFETQGSVQAVTTNVVLNTRELRLLGLSGVYNQLLTDGLPLVQGLTYTYGVSSYPGLLVENIFVSKGANSVLQGFESMSGQINVVPRAAEKSDRLLANVYINNFGEAHANANIAFKKAGRWANLTALHLVRPAGRVDRNEDGFLDLPLLSRIMVYNQFQYGDEAKAGFSARISGRWWHEERIGGQKGFGARDRGSDQLYGQWVKLNQPELSAKLNYRIDGQRNVQLSVAGTQQRQEAFFGTLAYEAQQYLAYANLQYEWQWMPRHELKAGLSYRYFDLAEQVAFTRPEPTRTFGGDYRRRDIVPGAFVENTFRGDQLTWIAGLRLDHHQQFGSRLTPRALLKYDFSEQTNLRLSAGTGWRTANIFSENIMLLASSRELLFTEDLRPEASVNVGLNLVHQVFRDAWTAALSLDLYSTRFQNQIFPDFDTAPGQAIIANFTGLSASNTAQAEAKVTIQERLELKGIYTFLDVYRRIDGRKQLLPFNAAHKVVTTASYEPASTKWHADANFHWYGRQRLPSTTGYPAAYQQEPYSPAYTIVSLQWTQVWPTWELYAGCENLLDFRQLDPILAADAPFGPWFDTAFNWGPVRGREVYLGVRFKIKGEKV